QRRSAKNALRQDHAATPARHRRGPCVGRHDDACRSCRRGETQRTVRVAGVVAGGVPRVSFVTPVDALFRSDTMRGTLAFIGTTIGGAIGWWIGARVGFTTAVIVSAVGSGVGLYYSRRIADAVIPRRDSRAPPAASIMNRTGAPRPGRHVLPARSHDAARPNSASSERRVRTVLPALSRQDSRRRPDRASHRPARRNALDAGLAIGC